MLLPLRMCSTRTHAGVLIRWTLEPVTVGSLGQCELPRGHCPELLSNNELKYHLLTWRKGCGDASVRSHPWLDPPFSKSAAAFHLPCPARPKH